MTFEFLMRRLRAWLKHGIDGFSLSDDWGTQEALLVAPALWRTHFKPLYAEIAREINARGRIPIIHSCGQVFDLIEDFVEIGWKAGNFQTHLLGAENLSTKFSGRFAFYGTLEYQRFMAHGTPEQIRQEAKRLKRCLWTEEGGFIAYTVAGLDVPLENLVAFLEAWEE
jgi:uroporphyrinogen decarboxylase